jgi:hypothetical protein
MDVCIVSILTATHIDKDSDTGVPVLRISLCDPTTGISVTGVLLWSVLFDTRSVKLERALTLVHWKSVLFDGILKGRSVLLSLLCPRSRPS